MIFEGFSKVFSTEGSAQYNTIGAFWQEMSAVYGIQNLRGLGCHWTETSIEYVIGLKEGSLPEDAPVPAGCERKSLILPDYGWTDYAGRTENLGGMYDEIYKAGRLDFEIERFDADGGCELSIFRKNAVPDAMQALLSRRSYRGRYCTDAVPRRDIDAILAAGLAAPSGCNGQTTSFAAVTDPAIMKKVAEAIDPPVAQTAPAGIFVLTQRINAYRDRCFAVQDYSAAIENMLLAITALGYASCWYEGHITDEDRICDKLSEILGIPEGYEMVCFLPVGIPETKAHAPQKKPCGERVFYIE